MLHQRSHPQRKPSSCCDALDLFYRVYRRTSNTAIPERLILPQFQFFMERQGFIRLQISFYEIRIGRVGYFMCNYFRKYTISSRIIYGLSQRGIRTKKNVARDGIMQGYQIYLVKHFMYINKQTTSFKQRHILGSAEFFDKMSRRKQRITHTSHSEENICFPSFSLPSWL